MGGNADVTLQMPGVAGLEMTVFANSATFVDGSTTGQVTISQVHLDKVPMPPPSGTFFMPPAWTVQPAGTVFDPPARISIPNDGLPPGRVIDIFQFDHALNEFINIGKGTVSDDASVIVSDPGFGITRAGWGGCGQPQPPTTCASGCVDENTCTVDRCENGARVHFPVEDGPDCGIPSNREFVSNGITFKVDRSCSKGFCIGGDCLPAVDRWGFDHIQASVESALTRIFDAASCNGHGVDTKQKMKDFLNGLAGGYGIRCIDSVDTNNNGTDDCASAALGGSVLRLSNLSTRECGPVAKSIRHEIQHSAGDPHKPKADIADDLVYGCDLACFGSSNRIGASADACL